MHPKKDATLKIASFDQEIEIIGASSLGSYGKIQYPLLEIVNTSVDQPRVKLVSMKKAPSPPPFNQKKKGFRAFIGEVEVFRPFFFHDRQPITVKDLILASASLAYNHHGDAVLPTYRDKVKALYKESL